MLFRRILALHVGEQLLLIGSGPSRSGDVLNIGMVTISIFIYEYYILVPFPMASELDGGYSGLSDAVWPL